MDPPPEGCEKTRENTCILQKQAFRAYGEGPLCYFGRTWDPGTGLLGPRGVVLWGLGYGTLGQNGIRVRDFGPSGEPEGN